MQICDIWLAFRTQLSGFVMPKPVNTRIPGYSPTDEINTADWIFCTFEYIQSSHYLLIRRHRMWPCS